MPYMKSYNPWLQEKYPSNNTKYYIYYIIYFMTFSLKHAGNHNFFEMLQILYK